MKKWFVLLFVLIGTVYFLYPAKQLDFSPSAYCPFCDSKVLERQQFYEDDYVIAMTTHKPIFPGHCLVIPKRHVTRFESLSEEEISHIGEAVKKVNLAAAHAYEISSYFILQKNGVEVGQSVPHLHFHYIPRKEGDGSTLRFIYRMFIANIGKPVSFEQNRRAVEKMKEGFADLRKTSNAESLQSEVH